jgi:hypothetical protein
MFNLSFFIKRNRRPDDEDLASVRSWSGKTFFKHKFWDLDFVDTDNLVIFGVGITRKCNHAGIGIEIGALFRSFIFHLYDSRHWDDENECWVKYTGTSEHRVDN